MEIDISTMNGRVPITVIGTTGNLDSSNYMDFQAKADQVIQGGARYILVDFSRTPYISTAGFRVLHHMFNELRALHPDANLTDEQIRKGINAGTYTSPHLKVLNLSRESQTAFEM